MSASSLVSQSWFSVLHTTGQACSDVEDPEFDVDGHTWRCL